MLQRKDSEKNGLCCQKLQRYAKQGYGGGFMVWIYTNT